MGGPSSAGLAPDAPPLPGEWREGSGIGFALAERKTGRPADPLLFALTRHHARMHDGRAVNAAERLRLAAVLVAPQRPAAVVPMAEAAPDDEAPAELTPRLKRRSRVAELVPAGKVTGWVPQWKRGDSDTSSEPAAAPLPHSAAQVAAYPPTADRAPETARMAGAPAVPPPSAGAPVETVEAPAPAKASPAKPPRPKRVPSIGHIIAVAERHAGLAPGGLGLGRAPAVTAARQVAMWLAFTLLQWDLARIGATFGRDRTTVRYAVQTVTERAERDDAFADVLDGLVAEAKVEPTARRRKTAP